MYNILIVDDEPAVISSLKRVIEKDKRFCTIGEAFSVKQAKLKMESQIPDIVITDIKMPGETGIDLLKSIMEQNLDILTIVLSGYDNFDYVHDAFIYGAEEYLLKPIEPNKVCKLLDKIAEKLDKRKVLDALIVKESDDQEKTPENYKNTADKMIDEIDRYLQSNLNEDHSLVVVCRKFAVSQPYLSKMIKKAKNCTYNEYLISLKIAEAKQLLRNRPDLLIADIAEATGFSDQFYFSRVFKNITGKTPSEFRNEPPA